jgi:hypothetical protein
MPAINPLQAPKPAHGGRPKISSNFDASAVAAKAAPNINSATTDNVAASQDKTGEENFFIDQWKALNCKLSSLAPEPRCKEVRKVILDDSLILAVDGPAE